MATFPQFSSIDMSHLDAGKAAEKAVAVVRDGVYITVGLGVLGVQRAAEFVKTSNDQMKQFVDETNDQVKRFVEQSNDRVQQLMHRSQEQAKSVVNRAPRKAA